MKTACATDGSGDWGTGASGTANPVARSLGTYHGTGEIVPFVIRTFEWEVVVAICLSVLSIVPRLCARLTYFLHPKLRQIDAVLIPLTLMTLTLRRAGSIRLGWRGLGKEQRGRWNGARGCDEGTWQWDGAMEWWWPPHGGPALPHTPRPSGAQCKTLQALFGV